MARHLEDGRQHFGRSLKILLRNDQSIIVCLPYRQHLMRVPITALSPTMTHGNMGKWVKQPGDEIAAGDVLCEVETDKAVSALRATENLEMRPHWGTRVAPRELLCSSKCILCNCSEMVIPYRQAPSASLHTYQPLASCHNIAQAWTCILSATSRPFVSCGNHRSLWGPACFAHQA